MDQISVNDIIYKVKQIKGNDIIRILVFSRNQKDESVFTMREIQMIETMNIDVIYCDNVCMFLLHFVIMTKMALVPVPFNGHLLNV